MDTLSVNELYADYNVFLSKLSYKKSKFEEAKKTNEQLTNLKARLNQVLELKNEVEQSYYDFDLLAKICKEEDKNYKNRRLAFIENNIEKDIDLIFPNEGFKPKISCDVKYNNDTAVFTLLSRTGRVSTQKKSEGRLCRQLISFSATKVISECFNLNKLYIDEAFTASSRENLTKISGILKTALDAGKQIILIEQEDGSYKDLPRREISIEKNPLSLETQIVSVKDY